MVRCTYTATTSGAATTAGTAWGSSAWRCTAVLARRVFAPAGAHEGEVGMVSQKRTAYYIGLGVAVGVFITLCGMFIFSVYMGWIGVW